MGDLLQVRVELMNDDGQKRIAYAEASTVEQAVQIAEETERALTGDDSYVMNDWRPA